MNAINGSPVLLIESSEAFGDLCNKLRTAPAIGLDTEFIRTDTFYGNLGLLQIYDSDVCYLVDPCKIHDWTYFRNLLETSSLAVVVHSSTEDLNLLKTSIDILPINLFDSQLAAAFLGIGFSLSYQALVKIILNVDIKKDETRSNWLKRPLSDSQLYYAANDVCFLLALREMLKEKLLKEDKLHWFNDECSRLLKAAAQVEDHSRWETSYSAISNSWKLETISLEYLQQLCYWRELRARELNKPKNWIVKDKDLYNICSAITKSNSLNDEALYTNEFGNKNFTGRYGQEMLEIIKRPKYALCPVDKSLLNTPLNSTARNKLKACQKIVFDTAQLLSISPELLGRKRTLQDLIKNYEYSGELHWNGELSGWRREILENKFTPVFTRDA